MIKPSPPDRPPAFPDLHLPLRLREIKRHWEQLYPPPPMPPFRWRVRDRAGLRVWVKAWK